MKIRYISNFTDGTEWAKSATYNVLALENSGHDIYCSEIKYNNSDIVFSDKIRDLLKKKADKYDVTIHHVLPMQYVRHADTKNIGFFPVDCTISDKIWKKKFGLMDQMLVPSKESKDLFIQSNVGVPVEVMYNTFDYEYTTNLHSKENVSQLNGAFNFVFINEFSKQKNMESLLEAFYSEFSKIEPVNILLAVDKDINTIKNFISEVKTRLKSPKRLKDELIFSGNLTDQDRVSLLRQCHCLVIPSYSESSPYIAMEAAAVGLPVIHTKNVGIESYLDQSLHYSVKSSKEYCYGAVNSIDGLYSCNDFWYKIDQKELRQKMRLVVNKFLQNQNEFENNKKLISDKIKRFDYRNYRIGEIL